jgi:hypothetical protein
MPVTPQRRQGIIAMEYGGFLQATGQAKVFVQERYTYNGQSCLIFKESADGQAAAKVACAKKAVKTIVDKNFNLPNELRFYCTSAYEAQNRAFNKDANWGDIGYITLGTTALSNGRADATSAMNIPGFVKGDITCIHEIGHVLHAHARGDDFHDPASNLTGAPANAGQVSGYAGMNRKEFVAEVFAGLMVGRHFSTAVMDEYMGYGGPH